MLTKIIAGFMFGLIFTTAFLARPAYGQVDDDGYERIDTPLPGTATCKSGLCVLHQNEYLIMRAIGFAAPAKIKALTEELEKLRAMKGCAKLEVTEPPKKIELDAKTKRSL